MKFASLASLLTLAVVGTALAADPMPQRYNLSVRASAINPQAKEHPELGYVFADDKGKAADLQHAAVDTRVPAKGKLVIWLMGHNSALFDRITGYGLHAVQVHYANKWFGRIPKDKLNDGTTLGKVRLEAATGEDHSPIVDIPEPDGLAARTVRFVAWLAKENPEGNWDQFLTADKSDLIWDKVILAGSSHGSTTAARFAVHRKVDRVVMFCGPRDQYETWQGFESATPSERFFGFSHVLDGGWTGHHYCRSWEMLGLHQHGPIVNVDTAPAPFGHTRRLVTNCDVNNDPNRAHGSVVPGSRSPKAKDGTFRHEAVWEYLFTHPVSETGQAVAKDPACRVKPPTGK